MILKRQTPYTSPRYYAEGFCLLKNLSAITEVFVFVLTCKSCAVMAKGFKRNP